MRRTRLCTASDSEPKFRLRSIGGVVVLGATVALGSLALGAMSAAASESTQGHATALTSASSTDEQDAVASYQALQSNLYRTLSSQLYQGLSSKFLRPLLVPLAVHERDGRNRILGRDPRWPELRLRREGAGQSAPGAHRSP